MEYSILRPARPLCRGLRRHRWRWAVMGVGGVRIALPECRRCGKGGRIRIVVNDG